LQVGLFQKRLHPVHVALITVRVDVRGFVGFTKTDQIRRYHPVPCGCANGNHMAVEVRPGRLAVHHQHRAGVGGAFIDVVHAQSAHL